MSNSLRRIQELTSDLGLPEESVSPYGKYKAKLDHRLAEGSPRENSRYVLVTAINPTPAGEGKTVSTIGLSMALNRIGKSAVCTIRQPSMGPVFGVKGGGAGGGRSQVVPMEELNLHLTGDFHAIAAANNLLAAAVDTSILLDNPLEIDPEKVSWRRVVDMNDRALREVRVGLGGKRNGVPRDSGFDITSASEIMSVVGLASDRADLRKRLGSIVVGESFQGKDICAEDLQVAGAMAAILKETLDPTLMQTIEGTPALVHTGPFANISYGNSSVIGDRMASRLFDYVVTEAGFGADMGAEKFFNIKCRVSGMSPDCAVVVATARALKAHSGHFPLKPGAPLPEALLREDLVALEEGIVNLEAQLATLALHGVPAIVAVNRFPNDTDAEIELIKKSALAAGAVEVATSTVFVDGSAGGVDLAEAVVRVCDQGKADFRHLYGAELPLQEKIHRLATEVYGAGSVQFSPRASKEILRYSERGYGHLPVCVAKTQYSLSHDAQFKGRPTGFVFPIREVRLLAGAGFLVPLAGDILTMPGLGRKPAYRGIDVDDSGEISGLF
ncbi:MAG: formate--tetrahydrofolate ligase [Planctomycetota bacterium]|jgi:formate--tetrahydrofolate ligase